MNKIFSICLVLISLVATQVFAQRYEVGVGAGTSNAAAGDALKNAASTGDDQSYWLGYGFNSHWGVELGLDHFDFDKINTEHQLLSLGAVYRFVPHLAVHPIAKLALGAVESKNFAGDKTNSIGAKLAGGIEADFKYVSVGALLNYHYISKAGEPDSFKDAQVVIPALFLTIHNAVDCGCDKKSMSTAPVATSAVAAKKDTDGDGVPDDEDKCPNTPAGTVVNKFGCAEKETASVKLDVEFAFGKTALESKYNSEIESLANFMKKHAETKVEIAGYTDNKGPQAKNLVLSQKRAEAVKAALVKAGIAASRLTAKGYGETHPLADNKTEEGRAQNRRVMAHISVESDKKK